MRSRTGDSPGAADTAPGARNGRGRAGRMLGWLPDSRAGRAFLLVAFVDAFGKGFFLAGSTLFYTQVVGLSASQVGLGLSAAALLGVFCAIPIGWLADRIGDSRTLILLQVWRGCGFLVYPFVTDFGTFLAVACLIGTVEQAVGPIIQSVAGTTAGERSLVRAMAVIAAVRNVGYTLSAVIATAVISLAGTHTYVSFVLANAAALFGSAALLTRLRTEARSPSSAGRSRPGLPLLVPLRDPRFLLLSLANGVLYLHVPILSVALPLWIVSRTDAPRGVVGIALAVNTILAVVLQVRLSKGGESATGAGRKQRAAGVALAVFSVLTAVTASMDARGAAALLLLAAVPLTLGELWQSAGGWGISYSLAPEAQRTYYLSVYQLGATVLTVAGPAVLSTLVVGTGAAGWFALAVVFLLVGLSVPFLARAPERGTDGDLASAD
ncbi:MFS transporter [Streptomyces sp. TG1A-8]|uniref:MFS transporter n=1 Tax=Streptomyces sp. TG1A-8 TaxID=3051385 RepID=UPI00265B8407|nr:MFS transporter [Streptomyces sp. TG1A-8]MDO0929513.1 MFS transporter [Streptomyces sp. TG1A-8]